MRKLFCFLTMFVGSLVFSGCSDSSFELRLEIAITAIQVTPPIATVPTNTTGNFTATAYLEDGTNRDITSIVAWRSSNEQVIAIESYEDNAGRAQAVAVGEAEISASFAGIISNQASITVVDSELETIQVTPRLQTLAVGASQSYQADGIYSDGTIVELTDSVVWSSTNSLAATIDPQGNATTLAPGNALITASMNEVSGFAALTVNEATIESLQISPASVQVPKGTTGSFEAIAYFSDGSAQDISRQATWQSSNASVIEIESESTNAGDAKAIAEGTAVITAEFQGLNSNNAPIEVTETELESIQITPLTAQTAVGLSVQFFATGIYLDSTLVDLTETVSWRSSDPQIATVDSSGLATGATVGEVEIIAHLDGIDSAVPFVVTPATVTSVVITPLTTSVPAGSQGQLTAIAFFSDGSAQNVTEESIWRSSDSNVVSIVSAGENAGSALALAQGQADISAQYREQMSLSATISVTPTVLESIQITPADAEIAAGLSQQFKATGIYLDGSVADITDSVVWRSSNSAQVTINSMGLATSSNTGMVEISARLGEIEGQTQLTISEALASSLQISPASVTVPKGTTGTFQALVFYSDGSQVDVTRNATWQSSDPAVASVISSGEQAGDGVAIGVGNAIVSARFQGLESNQSNVQVGAASLIGIQVTPTDASAAAGLSQQFTATGLYLDGSLADISKIVVWQTDDAVIATVDENGLVTTGQPGNVTVTATLQEFSGAASLEVTQAQVESVQVTPPLVSVPAGFTGTLTALAYFSDGTSRDVTREAAWSSSDNDIAMITSTGPNAGDLFAVAEGNAQASATFMGVVSNSSSIQITQTSLERIQVLPITAEISAGRSQQYSALGIYLDSSVLDITGQVVWQSSNTSVATIDNNGLATSTMAGTVNISASLSGINQQVELVVTDAVLESLAVVPASTDVPKGTTGDFTALAYYSDGSVSDVTSDAVWQSNDETVVSVISAGANAGNAAANEEGIASVTATYQSLTSNAALVLVTPTVLETIQITPINASTAAGLTRQFIATGLYLDGSVKDISAQVLWQSDNTSLATISSTGLASAISLGTAQISASLNAINANTSFEITPAVVTSIQITPPLAIQPKGSSLQYQATAYYSDNTAADITASALWQSSQTEVASIISGGPTAGQSVALLEGDSEITAIFEGVTSNVAFLRVSESTLEQLQVSPLSTSVSAGLSAQFQATGIYLDGSIRDLTNKVSWTSSDNNLATIDQAGLATTAMPGSVTIEAQIDTLSSSATLTISQAVIQSLQVSPPTSSIPLGGTLNYTALAYYTDNSVIDVSDLARWYSSDETVAQVISGTSQSGKLITVSEGSSLISAEFDGQNSNQSSLTVTETQLNVLQIMPFSPQVAAGRSIQLQAAGLYLDGSIKDLSQEVLWQSADTNLATIDSNGLVNGIAQGQVTIRASIDAADGSQTFESEISLTISQAVIEAIAITPTSLNVPAGTVTNFTALADLSDNTQIDVTKTAVWQSSDPGVAVIFSGEPEGGKLNTLAEGSSLISAFLEGFTSNQVAISVTETVLSQIELEPADEFTTPAANIQFLATGTYLDGTVADISNQVTWSSSNTSVATIGLSGLATAGEAGVADISATLDGITGNTGLTVTVDFLQQTFTDTLLIKLVGTGQVFKAPYDAELISVAIVPTENSIYDFYVHQGAQSCDDQAPFVASRLAIPVSDRYEGPSRHQNNFETVILDAPVLLDEGEFYTVCYYKNDRTEINDVPVGMQGDYYPNGWASLNSGFFFFADLVFKVEIRPR